MSMFRFSVGPARGCPPDAFPGDPHTSDATLVYYLSELSGNI